MHRKVVFAIWKMDMSDDGACIAMAFRGNIQLWSESQNELLIGGLKMVSTLG